LTHADHLPTPLNFDGSTSSIHPLNAYSLLVSISSMTSPSETYILELDEDVEGDGDKSPRELHKITDWSGKDIAGRLDTMKADEFWFVGADGFDVMGWVIKPRGWKEEDAKKGKVWPMGESLQPRDSVC
jgi:dipeptidyl aminopeptidase/acylaminoacyl peptidase